MLWCDVFGLLRSRRGDDTNRSTFQPCCYGRAHTARAGCDNRALGIMGFNRRKLEDGRREAAEKEAASRVTYTLLSLHDVPAAPL
jgi:hypothetical protein